LGFSRCAGIVLHPTSLPGPGGIGSIGADARRFIDFLFQSGIRLWQILPIGPTGYGDSPYSGHSAFAGNPALIDLESLYENGWIGRGALARMDSSGGRDVDYGTVVPAKMAVLRQAYERFSGGRESEGWFTDYVDENDAWLEDYSLFMALKGEHHGASWEHWETELRRREPRALALAAGRLHDEIQLHRFTQAVFARQWADLKQHAHRRQVSIVGDMPIFVAYDSADVWSHQDEFRLDADGLPEFVAGVPPDYFSPTGQLWGNPQYRWDAMDATGFHWWVQRFRALMTLVDVVRLDHFRGFSAAWWVPYGRETAEVGEWVPSPGRKLFEAVQAELGKIPIIAEDLGVITPDVVKLRHHFRWPGMKILQFAFGTDATNASLPHNVDRNTCVYTGTHDNDTTVGWYRSIDTREQAHVRQYIGTNVRDIGWQLMRLAFSSVADMALIPMQDVLRLGTEARMNTPGTVANNWRWRFDWQDIKEGDVAGLRTLTETYGR
jgi:4-alpha-glucanotransferase